MEDLFALNRRITSQLGVANRNIQTASNQIPVCLAKLKTDANGLAEFLGRLPSVRHENSIPDTSLNKEYLRYARQTARDVVAGGFHGLIVLHVDMQLAKTLASLTNQQINNISFRWPGLVFETADAAKLPVPEFHAAAVLHYPVALLAA